MILHYVYLVSLLAAAVAAFIWRRHLAGRLLLPFLPMQWYVVAQEFTMFACVQRWPTMSTAVVYNIYGIAITVFMAAIYYQVPFNKPYRRAIAVSVITYVLVATASYTFLQSVFLYNSYLQISGGFIIDCLGILFLFNYFGLDDPAEEAKWRPLLWITIGAVIYYPVVNISFALYSHLVEYKATFFGVRLYRVIPQTMSVFMYSCFIYAFYLCKKKN